MKFKRLIFLIVVLAAAFGISFWWRSTAPVLVEGRLISNQGELSGFVQADGVIPFSFPEDFGPHPDFQTEWWYYTGNLDTVEGRHFGYQLTFFRRALLPETQRVQRDSGWAADQIYFAHFSLTDVTEEQFYHYERFSRGAAGLAGALAAPYQVWLEDWEVHEINPGIYRISASTSGISINLLLEDQKGPVLQGEKGYSQKGIQPGSASYYYSQTRLKTTGEIGIAGQKFQVGGLSWKDHEFSTSALEPSQVGWDWFSIQLDNHIEIMLGQIRREDGSIDLSASGTIVHPNSSSTHLSNNDFSITVLDNWRSPHSGTVYPAKWRVEVPAENLTLTLTPYLADQELLTSVIYWEGAVSIVGKINGDPVTGFGYVELTGYAHSMDGGF